ncbi:hypothetical protein ACHAXM_009840 [Skeletonema potamos]
MIPKERPLKTKLSESALPKAFILAAEARKKVAKRSNASTSFVSREVAASMRAALAEEAEARKAVAAEAREKFGKQPSGEEVAASLSKFLESCDSDNNSIIERDPAEDVKKKKKKKIERKSDFRDWVENSKDEFGDKRKEPKKLHEILVHMWLDFVEAKVMRSVLCRVACGDLDDDETTASTATHQSDEKYSDHPGHPLDRRHAYVKRRK